MAKKLMSLATIPWMLAVAMGSLLFMSAMLNAVWALWGWSGSSRDTQILALPVGLLLGMWLWPPVLEGAWWLRRAYLRRRAKVITGTVVDTGYRMRRVSDTTTLHELQIEVEFTHPETGVPYRARKSFAFARWRGKRMRDFRDRFPVGATMPMRVRKRSTAFDVAERPAWADIW
ncbi:hypothetical protein [Nocardia higoensis]|uniref:hypothetical protein n=1 Tax=Nocardia higoensis TaxID=228599 RepID=UPI00030C72D4|nr:hypothetical protein [Nocardia higoensis]